MEKRNNCLDFNACLFCRVLYELIEYWVYFVNRFVRDKSAGCFGSQKKTVYVTPMLLCGIFRSGASARSLAFPPCPRADSWSKESVSTVKIDYGAHYEWLDVKFYGRARCRFLTHS
eukprot:scaffold2904_cov173-Amphora_coffeaeformis.AAC.7